VQCEESVDKHVEPLKRMMPKYETLIMKMSQDNVSIVQARFNLDLLYDLHMLLGLLCLLPLLEAMHALIKFVEGKDIFICDVVAIVKICQADLYMMYSNTSNNYQHEHFQVFSNVVENSFALITQDWVIHFNNAMKTLVFHIVGHSYVAHIFNPFIGAK
jgi:hypothetical protein